MSILYQRFSLPASGIDQPERTALLIIETIGTPKSLTKKKEKGKNENNTTKKTK